jgi:hypothetical protein
MVRADTPNQAARVRVGTKVGASAGIGFETDKVIYLLQSGDMGEASDSQLSLVTRHGVDLFASGGTSKMGEGMSNPNNPIAHKLMYTTEGRPEKVKVGKFGK